LRRSILAALLLAAPAAAHFAPSPDVNNRAIKITVLPDGVRVAYTVFFGERPGAGERRRMDADRNGSVDRDEAAAFGERLRREIAERVTIVVDGKPGREWSVSDVGLGSPAVAGGAFSVDMLLRAPLGEAEPHSLRFEDRLALPAPGDAHVRVEESPGVRLVEGPDTPGLQTAFDFAAGEKPTVRIAITVDPTLRPPRRSWLPIGAAMLGGIAAVTAALALRRRRRRR
jgi:hypothetical protein